jgi:hypothetical protein
MKLLQGMAAVTVPVSEHHVMNGCIEHEGKTPYTFDLCIIGCQWSASSSFSFILTEKLPTRSAEEVGFDTKTH